MEVRRQALEEERRRREDLEKRLQEETNRRQKMIDREVKLREKQRAQVGYIGWAKNHNTNHFRRMVI